jgi:hypothetical protein
MNQMQHLHPTLLAFGYRLAPLLLPAAPVCAQEIAPAGLATAQAMPLSEAGWRTLPVPSGEFKLQAYDSERGMISVSLPAEVVGAGPGAPRYRMRADAPLLVPVPPGLLGDVVDAERNGRMALDVSFEALPPAPSDGPDRPADLVEVRPTWVRLNIERNTVAEAAVGEVGELAPKAGAVEVGPTWCEARPLTEMADRQVRAATLRVARRCAVQAGEHVPSIRGALQIEVERSAIGERRKPKVVLDVTLCNRLVDCLTDGLGREDALWSALEDGDKAFIPIYFKGAPVAEAGEGAADGGSTGGNDPAVSGSVVP